MAIFEIPLTPNPQTQRISLAGVTYGLRLTWRIDTWLLDISDSSGNAMVQGIPLVTGTNLLDQYTYLGIAGELHVQTDNDPDAQPTFDNLGITSHLYFVS